MKHVVNVRVWPETVGQRGEPISALSGAIPASDPDQHVWIIAEPHFAHGERKRNKRQGPEALTEHESFDAKMRVETAT